MYSLPSAEIPRVALIGVSGYARIHYQILTELAERGALRLAAAVIINPAEEADKVRTLESRGCRIYADYREMLDRHRGRLDLCCIPTGIGWHAEMTIAALAAGANVLVEKPLAATLAEVRAIGAAEAAAGRFVAVAFQDIYQAEALALKQALLAGRIGRVRSVDVIGLWPRPATYYRRNNWAGRIRLNGQAIFDSPVSNAFAHYLNLGLFFAGRDPHRSAAPAAVEADLYRAQAIENYDTVALRIATATGIPVHFHASHSATLSIDPVVAVEGEAGRIVWEDCRAWRLEGRAGPGESGPLPGLLDLRRRMFAQVLRRLADPAVFTCGLAIAAEHTRCIEQIQSTAVIHQVDPRWLETLPVPADGGGQIVIRGLEHDLPAASAARRLFRETGCPWAVHR